jgi:hypothetical protein
MYETLLLWQRVGALMQELAAKMIFCFRFGSAMTRFTPRFSHPRC